MIILTEPVTREQLVNIEERTFFDDMMKCVADLDQELLAVNADLHADLETMLLKKGRRVSPGRQNCGRSCREKKIEEIVEKWILN